MSPVEPAYFDSNNVQSQLCVLWCVVRALPVKNVVLLTAVGFGTE